MRREQKTGQQAVSGRFVLWTMLWTVAVSMLWILPAVVWGQETATKIPETPEAIQAGKVLYEQKCAQCHGIEGKGDGPAAERVFPRPRDFTSGLYKIRTTYGNLPTDEDLFRTITRGMPGSSMPAWSELTPTQRWQLVYYIKTFYPGFQDENQTAVLKFENPVEATAESIETGRQLYMEDFECVKCHGNAGRGDGPSALELVDDWGNPIYPANLTQNWNFRGGGTREDIYRTFVLGLKGTPMPTFGSPDDDAELKTMYWHLANYVRSLSPEKPPEVSSLFRAVAVEGSLPDDPKDPQWDQVPSFYVPIVGQVIVKERLFTPSVTAIFAKALYNSESLAIRLQWDDRTQSKPDGENVYTDAVAVQFPVRVEAGAEKPYFLMGDDKRPVNLWYWQSEPEKVTEYNATGIQNGAIRWIEQPAEGQTVEAKAVYEDGQYQLILKRSLATGDTEQDIVFIPGQFIPITFFAWDGSHGETGSKMGVSTWYNLILEPAPSNEPYVYTTIAVLVMVGIQIIAIHQAKRKS